MSNSQHTFIIATKKIRKIKIKVNVRKFKKVIKDIEGTIENIGQGSKGVDLEDCWKVNNRTHAGLEVEDNRKDSLCAVGEVENCRESSISWPKFIGEQKLSVGDIPRFNKFESSGKI